MSSFAGLMRRYRERAGLSQRALARSSHINPATVSRMENGGRGPSGPEQVMAMAPILQLNDDECDRLLAAAGYWSRAILRLGPQDETLLVVARVLAAEGADPAATGRFREVIGLLAEQWTAQAG